MRIHLFYERHFEYALKKVLPLLQDAADYSQWSQSGLYLAEDKSRDKEDAMRFYFGKLKKNLMEPIETPQQGKKMFEIINRWIMAIHERMRVRIGEEWLGLDWEDLEGLNFIDIQRPLQEQLKIIAAKLKEIKEKYPNYHGQL